MKSAFSGIGSILQTPFGVIAAGTVVFHGVLFAVGFNYSVVTLVIAVVVLIINLFVANYITDKLIYFFSQFVLPVQTPKDGRKSTPVSADSMAAVDRSFSSRTDELLSMRARPRKKVLV